MKPTTLGALSALPLLVLLACSPLRDNEAQLKGPDDPCLETRECGSGLVCAADGVCTAFGQPGTAGPNDVCAADTDCRLELICTGAGRCAATDQRGDEGAVCKADGNCEAPFVCDHGGHCATQGGEGTAALDGACVDNNSCGYGLICSPDDMCAARPKWGGVTCGSPVVEGPPRVLFEVPRGTSTADFFRLPFPDDSRRETTGLNLSGFPGLEQSPAPASLIGALVSSLEQAATGFGLNSSIVFRFSAPLAYDTLRFGGDDATFMFVDVTEGSSVGRRPRSRFFATTDRSPYICHNWLAIRPSEGTPLEPGHTYAAFFRKGLTDTNGTPLEADTDLTALLGDTPPAHPAMRAAWSNYQPFRAWLATAEIPTEDIVGSAVFTTAQARTRTGNMRAAVHAAPVPTLEDLTVCDGGTASPCDGPGRRACGDVNPLFTEVHAVANLPDFLTGVPPYRSWGGTMSAGDQPRLQRQTQACVGITLPRGDLPPDGWPVVLYAPDVGDGFRSFIDNGFANRMARLGWAVVSLEPILDGNRFGEAPPEDARALAEWLDDLDRPERTRDLLVQSTAELFAMTRLLRAARALTADGEIRFDGSHLTFFGHGRGSRAGVPFLAYEPDISAAILASATGGWIDTMRFTTSPNRPGFDLATALADDGLNGMHPALHLLQTVLDPADPMNYGPLLRRPPEGVPAKHLLMMVGMDNSHAPLQPVNHLAISARFGQMGDVLAEFDAVEPIGGGYAEGNVNFGDGPRTQALKQYAPGDSGDGHLVPFESQAAIGDLTTFFTGLLEDDGVPRVNN